MKNRKKAVMLGLALAVLLALMIGGIVAKEQVESHTVYTNTPSFSQTFSPRTQESWMWFITIHESGGATLEIIENGQIIFEVSRLVTDEGNVNVQLQTGHTYTLTTAGGTEQIPGQATCTIATYSGGGDKPHP